MDPDFTNISYLKTGNVRQKAAHRILTDYRVMEILAPHFPILAGTIPIGIDIPGSDLDIICHAREVDAFAQNLCSAFGDCEEFAIGCFTTHTVASFFLPDKDTQSGYDGFTVEVFGQDLPSCMQNAYRHMLAEHWILERCGESFRGQIVEMKRQGMKTEPAFAKVLGLEGDPYRAMLDVYTELYPQTN